MSETPAGTTAADVVVVGLGAAGTGAALAAAAAGVSVLAIDGGTGASLLSTGALDLQRWQAADATEEPPPAAKRLLEALGTFVCPHGGAMLLTTAGIVRPARAHDAALLDVTPRGDRRIAVVRCLRPGWDADSLARAWGPSFVAIDASLLKRPEERALPDADFAQLHDEPARLTWLGERLREALDRAGGAWGAVVVPASLGVDRPRADVLGKQVGIACGEAMGAPGGPSGLRFARARDRAVFAAGARIVRTRAKSIERDAERWRVTAEDGMTIDARAVVLAMGGFLGGGLEYAPAETTHATALPARSTLPFRLSMEAPVSLGTGGTPMDLPSSLFGVSPETFCWPFVREGGLFERVGVLVDAEDACSPRSTLLAAGEVVADGPRTWLGALASGARAGAAAARGPTAGPRASAPSFHPVLPSRS